MLCMIKKLHIQQTLSPRAYANSSNLHASCCDAGVILITPELRLTGHLTPSYTADNNFAENCSQVLSG